MTTLRQTYPKTKGSNISPTLTSALTTNQSMLFSTPDPTFYGYQEVHERHVLGQLQSIIQKNQKHFYQQR